MTSAARRPRVLMVCTRASSENPESGHDRVMAFTQRSLRDGGDVEILRIYPLFERRSARRILSILGAAMGGVLSGCPIPLQVLLFHDLRHASALEEAVARFQPDAVYFDGVRAGALAFALRKLHPQLRLVCDFEDLMSRRIEVLAQARQPLSMGYLKKYVPDWIQRHVLDGFFVRMVQGYEQRSLRSIEGRLAQVCNQIVLLSAEEANLMAVQHPGAPVVSIPPALALHRAPPPLQRVHQFVFIGSDSLLQNRQSIEFLVALWARARPSTPLHVFGKQSGAYAAVENVVFRGFVKDVADAYEAGSILLAPSFLPGGVKTKVLEAMSFGIVPLGTAITFAGIAADCTPLTPELAQLEEWVVSPQRWCDHWLECGASIIAAVGSAHSESVVAEQRRQAVWPTR